MDSTFEDQRISRTLSCYFFFFSSLSLVGRHVFIDRSKAWWGWSGEVFISQPSYRYINQVFCGVSHRLESSQQFVNYIQYHRRQLFHRYSHLGCDNSLLRRWFNATSSSPLERGNVYAVDRRRPLNTVEDKRVDNTAMRFRFDACWYLDHKEHLHLTSCTDE